MSVVGAIHLTELRPFLVGTAIGLGIGLERDWAKRGSEQQAAGSRTFALLGLVGVLARSVSLTLAEITVVGVAALVVAGYVRTGTDDRGTTTEVAAMSVYLLGVLTWTDPELAVALAVVVGVLLASRAPLHRLTRELITGTEIDDALRFFVIAFVVLPLLPHRQMGPYGVLNPAKIWLLVVAVTGIGWVGYVAVRALGDERGLLLTGFAGGFISASATTAALGRRGRVHPGQRRTAVAGALLASAATFVQLAMVTAVANRRVFERLLPTLATGTGVILLEAAVVYRLDRRSGDGMVDPEDADVDRARPFALKPALVLAAVLTLVLLIARWGSDVAGSNGTLLTTGLAGFADVHAAVLTVATLVSTANVAVHTALVGAGLALLTNTLTKVSLAFGVGGRAFGLRFSALLVAPAVTTAIVLVLTINSSRGR